MIAVFRRWRGERAFGDIQLPHVRFILFCRHTNTPVIALGLRSCTDRRTQSPRAPVTPFMDASNGRASPLKVTQHVCKDGSSPGQPQGVESTRNHLTSSLGSPGDGALEAWTTNIWSCAVILSCPNKQPRQAAQQGSTAASPPPVHCSFRPATRSGTAIVVASRPGGVHPGFSVGMS